jgi:hypothetical protein
LRTYGFVYAWLRGLCCWLPVRVGSVLSAVLPVLFMLFSVLSVSVVKKVICHGEWIHY